MELSQFFGPKARRQYDKQSNTRKIKRETFSPIVQRKFIDFNSTPFNSRFENGKSRKMMNANNKLALMTWIEHPKDKNDTKGHLQKLLDDSEKIMTHGVFYSCCELFDSYCKGGLYPLFHCSTDQTHITELIESGNYLESTCLGPDNIVEQAVYEEVACISMSYDKKGDYKVLVASGFKSADGILHSQLIKEWKSWTGARGFMIDLLEASLSCHQVKFYAKILPEENIDSFFYIVTTEVWIAEPNDEGLLADLLQRFRVERWLGFRSIYRTVHKNHNEDLESTIEKDTE